MFVFYNNVRNTIILFDNIQFLANQLFIETLMQLLRSSHVHKQLA